MTVQLIDGATGFQVWTASYNKSTDDLLAIQQEIAIDVVAQMLPEADPEQTLAASATIVASANEFMLLARQLYREVRETRVVDLPKLLQVIDYYRRATEADPTSASGIQSFG